MSRRLALAAWLVVIVGGCYHAPPPSSPGPAQTQCIDADGDGFCADLDCNDQNNTVYPGAPDEQGDGIDQNCDGYY